jgi:hypothetical protein
MAENEKEEKQENLKEEDVENPAEKRELKKRHAVDHVKDKINRLKI